MALKYLILTLFFLTTNLNAESFFITDKAYEFVDFQGVLISECKETCRAKKVINMNKKINQSALKNDIYFENSLGSQVCDKIFKGQSVLGQAANRDRRAFCIFEDFSMIEINSLTDYLKKKKIVKGK